MKENQSYRKGVAGTATRLFTMVMFLFVTIGVFAQSRTITGTVKDEAGLPIVGATILELGTTNGTITDFDGNFKINVNGAVISVGFIGYLTQDIDVSTTSNIDVVLLEDAVELDAVVVVGYGAQKKESVVGAISQVSSEELLSSPAANVTQALTGKLPGVITTQASGAPGSDDATINIRGRATFAGSGEPLVLVDGIERPFSQIAPDDIETISVLKDASATAVYGVRGANGVLLVTTKRGKDQKPEVNVTANFQTQSPTREDSYLNSYESVQLLEEALSNDGLPSQFSSNDIEMYRKSANGELSGVESLLYPNVDWYDEVLENSAPAQRYNVSVRGGTKRMRYYVSGEIYNQKGLIKELSEDPYDNTSCPSYRRFAFRANMDLFLTKDLTFSVNFGTRFENRRGANTDESGIFYELNHTPGWLFPVKYVVKNGDEDMVLYGGSSQYQNNIVALLAKGGYYKSTNTINETNFIVDYDLDWLTEGLSVRGMMSFDYDSYYKSRYHRSFATYELNDRDNYLSKDAYNKFNADGELSHSNDSPYTEWKLYMEGQINYARRFGAHDVTAMALYNQNDRRYKADLAYRYQGIVGRATYGYDDRYLAEVNIGYNGSENFAEGKRFGFFPAFSAGWRISQEEFMQNLSWLTNLKLRGSYGQVGNDGYYVNGVRQRFLYEEKWSQINNDYYFGSTGQTGIYEAQYPNSDVTWERAHKYNLGLEFGIFDDLITGNLDLFKEEREDILTTYLSRPEWVGVVMAAGNIGETKNSGYEIELHHRNTIGADFRYNLDFTFSHAKNEIVRMDEPELKTDYRKREGQAIDQYFGLVCDGFITEADVNNASTPVSTFGTTKVGDLKYRDMNNDGFIDERDETAIGYSNIPENTYSFGGGMNWKGIGFNILFQGVTKVSRYYDAEAQFAFVSGGKVKEHHLDRWNPNKSEAENLASAKYPLLHYDSNGDHNQRLNSFFLKNGAYLRLKNIEVSYTLPKAWISRLGMSDCRVYANANNLVTWDKLDDLCDPESNGSNRYPIMKTMNIGVNIKF